MAPLHLTGTPCSRAYFGEGVFLFYGPPSILGEKLGKARLPEQSYRAGGELRGIISDENAPPIHAQGQAVVVAEAFAARLCVLATRIGGIREVVENGVTGMLVQPQDSQALAGGIEKLLTDSELRQKLAKSGFLRARRNYHWEKIAADFEGLYRALIEKDANTRSHNTGA